MKQVAIKDALKPPFLQSIEEHEKFFLLRLQGAIRTPEIGRYYDKMTNVIETVGLYTKSILCDFGGVTAADTATIAALITRLSEFRKRGTGKLVLFNVAGTLRSLFEIARLADLFILRASREEAEAALEA